MPKVPGNLVMIDATAVYATDSGIQYTDVALVANVQPLDAELTSIAGLTSAANKLPYFTGSGTAALADFTAFARTILDDADAAAVRTTLSVPSGSGTVSGTNTGDQDLSSYATTAAVAAGYQPLDAELTAIAGLTSAADRLPYFTGSGTAALATFTAAGRALVDDADSSAMRTTLNLVIGADVQQYNSNLAAFAGLTIASDSMTVGTGLASFSQITLSANKFLAKASTGGLVAKDITDFGLSLIDDADAETARTTLGVPSGSGTVSGTNTGDQTITLTGNVTGSGTGSFTTTIASGVVTLAMQANVATGTVFYRKTAGTGVPEVQTLATLKTDLGLTGTNSGDQTITLTGNVTGSGTGSFATTIAAGVVTLAMQANVATGTVFYRKTAGTGAPEVNTLATLKTDLGLTGTNSGDQTITLTGNVTGSGTGSFATTIANSAVTLAKMANLTGLSVIGTTGPSTSTPTSIAGAADQVLRVDASGTTLGFGTIATAGIANSAVTLAKMANVTGLAVLGMPGSGSAAPSAISTTTADSILRVTGAGTSMGWGTIDLSKSGAVGSSVLPSANMTQASDSVSGAIEIATAAEVETGSDATRAVTPARQQRHPSAAKARIVFTISGTTVTIRESYNVTSVTRNGVGDYDINLTTAFSSEYYNVICNTTVNTAGSATLWGLANNISPPTASVCKVVYVTSGGVPNEAARVEVTMFGDQ